MQNNPNGPYDDVFNNLAKIVEDIVKNMPESQHAQIIGYTIITRQPSPDHPQVCPFDPSGSDEIPYEVIESDNQIFITAVLPVDLINAPYADIDTHSVRIVADEKSVTIMLDTAVDRTHSHYRIHRGLMDISLKKGKNPFAYTRQSNPE